MWPTSSSSEQGPSGPRLLGSGRCSMGMVRLMTPEVERRAGQVPEAADAGQAVASARWRGRRPGLRPPPPRDERAVGPAPLEQQLVVHGQLADLGPQPGDLVVPVVGRPALQRGLAAGQEVVPPAGEGGGGHVSRLPLLSHLFHPVEGPAIIAADALLSLSRWIARHHDRTEGEPPCHREPQADHPRTLPPARSSPERRPAGRPLGRLPAPRRQRLVATLSALVERRLADAATEGRP